MIASLSGAVQHVGLDRAVIEVGGIGVLVYTTPRTASGLRTGAQASLATTLVVREDSLTLYGFDTSGERDTFETVQTVSGVGPRIALAMLAVLSPDEVARAVGAGDVTALTKVPGIGRKGAERLVLELRDKIGHVPGADAGAPSAAAGWQSQVTEALVGLGYTSKQADVAVDRVTPALGADPAVADALRAALRELGR
ncbi:Holliday junction branch migration protein RuvA [Janibacter sp. G56]|uniref:Holliday junction branch migration protein RuvA n=1 Tax=Janibacter sp. G56 TaxID=3418717 RepID=UPI003CFFB2C4